MVALPAWFPALMHVASLAAMLGAGYFLGRSRGLKRATARREVTKRRSFFDGYFTALLHDDPVNARATRSATDLDEIRDYLNEKFEFRDGEVREFGPSDTPMHDTTTRDDENAQ